MTVVLFTAKQAAKDLWEFGEDELIEKALHLSDKILMQLHSQVGKNLTKDMLSLLGKTSNDYDLGQMTALSLVIYFEGKPRPLARKRRRNSSLLPDYLHSTLDELIAEHMKYLPSA
jgi:hypothetical protein